MNMKDAKGIIVDALEHRGVWTRQVHSSEWVTRCPYCGDSKKRLNTGHLYLYINIEDSTSIKFFCHKCPASGILTKDKLVNDFDITESDVIDAINYINKGSLEKDRLRVVGDSRIRYNFLTPPIIECDKTKYIENRLNRKFTNDEFEDMKLIISLKDFLTLNHLKPNGVFNRHTLNMLEFDYVGFLSYGCTHILFRDVTGNNQLRWIIYPITEDVVNNPDTVAMYTVRSEIDILNDEKIVVNISEGVLDALSSAYLLTPENVKSLNIAVCGKYYQRGLLFLIENGIFGNNVIVNLILDNDREFNKKGYSGNTIKQITKLMEDSKGLYGEVNLVWNVNDKDIGVPKDKIRLEVLKL